MAASDITATERAEPVAWIEHHKGGDNLVWDPQKNGLRYSPLYLSTSPSQAQGETVCPGCGERPAGLCAECRLTASQHTTDPLIAALYAEQDRAHRYLARAEQAESALAAAERRAEEAGKKYEELLYAVASKWPNETWHQTALRYIREREAIGNDSGDDAELKGEKL